MVKRIPWLIPVLSLFWSVPPFTIGQTPMEYHRIQQRGNIHGSVMGPGGMVIIKGESIVEYDERILGGNGSGNALRTLRHYHKANLVKDQGGQLGEGQLRNGLNPLVILRQGTTEVPFSPRGPMTLGEVDLLRTDVFVGALKGLLPPRDTPPGGSWEATEEAVCELTDLERIQKGSLKCTLTGLATGASAGQVTFQGTVLGPQEEGLARHEISGSLEPDGVGSIRHLELKATQVLLGPGETERGRIVGRFSLDRRAVPPVPSLADPSLVGLKLFPDEFNSRLLVEIPGLGLGFTMSRRWRIISQSEKQVRFGLPGGAEMVLTLEGANLLPGLGEMVQEAKLQLQKEKHRPGEPTPPVAKDGKGIRMDYTTVGVLLQDGSQNRWMYGVSRLQSNAGGLLAGRFPRTSWVFWDRELEESQRLGLSLYKLAK